MLVNVKEKILTVEKKWALRWFIWRRYKKVFASIRENDVVIDCGANVGDVTAEFVKRGAVVYAFEPHPEAFAVLRERFFENKRVHPLQKAVWIRNEKMKLYMHKDSHVQPLRMSVAASLLSKKGNISKEDYIQIEAVDFSEFIKSVGGRVKIVKMDVEGAEYEIIPHLIKTGAIENIGNLLVETHYRKNPGLGDKHKQLVREILARHLSRIDLEWT